MEEVSTFLDSENKIKTDSESGSEQTDNSAETTTNECCDVSAAGIDSGSVIGPGPNGSSLADLATKSVPVNTDNKDTAGVTTKDIKETYVPTIPLKKVKINKRNFKSNY
jgi:hypothetical protein